MSSPSHVTGSISPAALARRTIWSFAMVAIAASIAGCGQPINDYPDPPFVHVLDDFPEVIPLTEEPPSDDVDAFDAYWEARNAIHEHSRDRSILADATEVEKELFDACYDSRYATARQLADEILRDDPLSIVGLYAIADVEYYAEGDLPYALNSIRQARRQAEKLGRANPSDPIAQEWYVRTLSLEYDILSDLDRSEDLLRVVDRLEAVYAPLPWLKAWALMKLQRIDESREVIEDCLRKGVFEQSARNTLVAIEDKLQQHESSVTAARELVERFPNSRVFLYNLGLLEACNAHFAEAEAAFLASASATEIDFDGSPYITLASLLVQQGRFAEALDAIKQAQRDRGDRDVHTLQQDESQTNLAIASLLVALNEPDLALRFSQRAAILPDRTGSTSAAKEDVDLSTTLVAAVAQKFKHEQLLEHFAIGSAADWTARGRLAAMRADRWRTRQRFMRDLDHEKLINFVRPYVPGTPGIESQVQSWHRFQLLELVPRGVLERAIDEADTVDPTPLCQPYLQAIRARVELEKGNDDAALRLATDSLDRISARNEKVFRAHTAAIAGQAAWNLGRLDAAMDHWTTTLRDFPQAFRLLSIALPISVDAQPDERSRRVAETLVRSERFFASPAGCPVVIGIGRNDDLVIEFFRNRQSRHVEVSIPIESTATFAEAAVAAFHDQFFQPLVELTQSDLGSLDGSPIAARLQRNVDELFLDFAPTE